MRLPFSSDEIVMESPLPPEEVRRRLYERVARWWDGFSSRERLPVGGGVREGSCTLYARPPMFMHNSFIRVLVLRFEPTAMGTRLVGRFRLTMFVLIFMALWLGILTIMEGVFLWAAVARNSEFTLAAPWVLVPLGILVFGAGVFALGRMMARGAESTVVEFVKTTVSAVSVRGEEVAR